MDEGRMGKKSKEWEKKEKSLIRIDKDKERRKKRSVSRL